MSNKLLQSRIVALMERNGSSAERLVRELLRNGRTTIFTNENGTPLSLSFDELSDTMKIIVVTACEEFLDYNGHGVKFAPFMVRYDNAISVARSKLGNLAVYGRMGCTFRHLLSEESIEDGLAVFSEMVIAQANKHLPHCFVGADVSDAVKRVKARKAKHHKPGRKGERPSRSLVTSRH